MKKASLVILAALINLTNYAQTDSTGLEGDNLDLNGVLELFKDSKDLEDFEKKLNSESNGVNNLDLNDDGEVDYIRVVDYADSNTHSVALQVSVNETESQDVAVLEMEQDEKDNVTLQVIGDSELYGEEYMIEPADENSPSIVVNVNHWRPVRYMYGPKYVVWRSPYRWGYYPKWYRPWKRVTWAVYHPRVIRYHRPYYRRATVRRCHRAHKHYHAHHVHSPYFKSSQKSYTVKTKNGNVGVKKTTTVKKEGNDSVVKKNTTVKKSSDTKGGQKTTNLNNQETQSKSSKTKRPGGVKSEKTTKKTSTKSRKGRR